MMDVGLSLPLRILLLLNHRKDGGVFFKEIVEHINRDKGQVSNVLKKLANERLIVKENNKPKRIVITDTGREKVKSFLVELQQYEQVKEMEKVPQKSQGPFLNKQKLFDRFITKLKPNIEEDLSELSQYLTADTLNTICS